MTIREWTQLAQGALMSAGIESAGLEAQLLAAHVLLVDRVWLFAHADVEFPDLAGNGLLLRRLSGEPLAYILGWREFYGRRFSVGPGALVPRHETETLVESAADYCRSQGLANPRILDLCTGSGCVGITLKLELPGAEVVCSDISPEALCWAEQNSQQLGAKVELRLSDGFSNLPYLQFDLIVSNPPYIGLSEALPSEVKNFEPSEALFAGETGLDFYRRIAVDGKSALRAHGRIFMEVGHTQADEVLNLFVNEGWKAIEAVKDLAGIRRVVICEASEWT